MKDSVKSTASMLGIQPEWLEDVMWIESKLDPKAVNRITRATGLIQFMPETAKSLGTSVDELAGMTFDEQMNYVYVYLRPYAGRMTSLADVYFAVFFPAAIGQPDDYVLKTSKLSAALIAKQNPSYDLNGDGQITRGEITRAITSILKKKRC